MQFTEGQKVLTKVKSWGLNESKEKKTPGVWVKFENGVNYQGYFTAGAMKHAVKALYNMGFEGNDPSELNNPNALDKTKDVEVEITIEKSQDGTKVYYKARWVNKPYTHKPVDPNLIQSMKGIDLRAYMMENKQNDQNSDNNYTQRMSGDTHSNAPQTEAPSSFTADDIPF